MTSDTEPRYRLVDADGNVVGSLFAESDGTLKLQEGTSGNDNELSLTTQGALEVEQAQIGKSPITAVSRTIADDDVITLAGSEGSVFIILGDGALAGHAIAMQRFNDLRLGASDTATSQGSDPLNGTTGPDGSLNVSSDGDTLNIENRTGISRTYTIIEFRR